VVDTGLQGILIYREHLRTRLAAIEMREGVRNVSMGRLQVKELNVPRVSIANLESRRTIYLLDDHNKETVAGVDGFFGPSELHARVIEFDFANGALRWLQ
jgi:hypothetical protein